MLAATAASPASAAASWPTWGNLTHSDCAFAAAANWEVLHGGTSATEESILAESAVAEHGADEGVDGDTFESFWRVHGIGGRRERVRDASPAHLRRAFRRHGAIIAELAVTPGERYGAVEDELGGVHYAVVRYVTQRGPILLTWGKLAQMTWWQWREDALLLYLPS